MICDCLVSKVEARFRLLKWEVGVCGHVIAGHYRALFARGSADLSAKIELSCIR